jgi:hypothetical protein
MPKKKPLRLFISKNVTNKGKKKGLKKFVINPATKKGLKRGKSVRTSHAGRLKKKTRRPSGKTKPFMHGVDWIYELALVSEGESIPSDIGGAVKNGFSHLSIVCLSTNFEAREVFLLYIYSNRKITEGLMYIVEQQFHKDRHPAP